ncbi:MAG: hypothetical protein ACFFCH_11580 [Promethearchaeota archaeon]
MIRRTRILLFLSVILGSSVLLGLSMIYQTDTYTSLSFAYEVTEIRVFVNESTSRYQRVQVRGQIYNPALFVSTDLVHTDTHFFLNGEQLYYGFGFKGGRVVIPPGEYRNFNWQYSLTDSDQTLFQAAQASGNWNWVLVLEPLVQTPFLAQTPSGRVELYRLVFYFETTLVPL